MRFQILTLAFFLLPGWAASAFNPDFGAISVGASVGTMSAVSGKFWIDKRFAVDLGVLMVEDPGKAIYADAIYHFRGLLGKSSRLTRESLPYIGAGVGAGFWKRSERCDHWKCDWPKNEVGTGNGFFLRVVGGLEWFPKLRPFGVFFETGPSYMWYPGGGVHLEITLGGRYYF